MSDVAPSPPTLVSLPRHLGRPDFQEISKEVLVAADPFIGDASLPFLRQGLQEAGPSMLKVLGSVRTGPLQNTLPTEIPIVVNDSSASLPTHMMAIYGPPPQNPSAEKRKITLYPVHSTVLAAYCAKLPAFRPTSDAVMSATPEHIVREVTIPVRPICLPSPQTYPQLSSFLYTKRTDALLASMMPCLPPQSLANQSEIITFATRLAGTYTIHALLQHAMTVHGLWGNVCALGIFDDALWDTIDLAWQVLLTAIAIGTGNPQDMISSA
ncbi:hypothetical protein BDZ94DRAFT_1164331 [Collybia nuda]|uniref:Clp1-like protein n=1 Tax=Collybia nuda TaxID=64659 RepID=A0A9P6CIF5_9AGAR|nr:hypothetical protein BDZ94DRAFT_1164331 [Collybia nuda]